ncbi:MAG: choice-of-anchor D domain-containing protein [Bacteroidota bacterium]
MRRLSTAVWIALGLLVSSTTAFAQLSPEVIYQNEAVRFAKVGPLSELVPQTNWLGSKQGYINGRNKSANPNFAGFTEQPLVLSVADNVQRSRTLAPGPAPFVNFDGPAVSDNPSGLAPPDPSGAIGINQYVQMSNLITEIFDRDGNSLTGPFPSNAFFTGLGGACQNDNDGDPIVIYDAINDRWVVSQFAVTTGTSQCIAVSETGDATGDYFVYEFQQPGFNDYPKIGLSPSGDELFVTYRMFQAADFMVGTIIDYASMRQGMPATEIAFDIQDAVNSLGETLSIDGFLPVNYTGTAPSTANGFFGGHIDDGAGASADQFVMVEVTSFDFGTGDINVDVTGLAVDPFDSNFCGTFGGCIDQPAGGGTLDALAGFTMFSLSAREIGGELSMVTTHTTDVGTNHAAIRWYEFRRPAAGWNVKQQGTYAPDADDRWMGSAAQDADGNIFIGYTVSGANTNPTIAYAAHTVGAAAGTLNIDETIIHASGGVQTSNLTRWGDYSQASVDPVNPNTFWYTHEYIPSTGSFNWATRVAGVDLGSENDTEAPLAVNDLAVDATGSFSMDISWTAVGDDPPALGPDDPVTAYDIRISTADITADNFDDADQVVFTGTPGAPGDAMTFTIEGLMAGTTYYVAIKGVDNVGNTAEISNVATGETLAQPEFDLAPASLSFDVDSREEATQQVTITNTATEASTLSFAFPRFMAQAVLADETRAKNDTSPAFDTPMELEKGQDDPRAGLGKQVVLGAGGPDAFGYLWIDSDEDGIEAQFEDISSMDDLELGDDGGATFNLPFDFAFYGETFSTVSIASNGYLTFGTDVSDWSNDDIPSSIDPNNLIAPLWDDFSPQFGGSVHAAQAVDGSFFIAQWETVPFYNFDNPGSTSNTFQVVLFADGSILFNYEDVEDEASLGATVGLENGDASDGLRVAYNTDYVKDNFTVALLPPSFLPAELVTGVSPMAGTLGATESQVVDITASGGELGTGNYIDELFVMHNGAVAVTPITDAVELTEQATLEVTASVTGFPEIDVDVTELDFGTVFVGANDSGEIVIENTGTDPLDVTDITVDNDDYALDVTSGTLEAGESMTVTVTYTPAAAENDDATVTIANSAGDDVTVALLGDGANPPIVGVSPEVMEEVTIDEFSTDVQTRTVTVSNTGEADLEVNAMVAMADPNGPAPTAIDETPFFSREITPGSSDRTMPKAALGSTGESGPFAPVSEGFEGGEMPPEGWIHVQNNASQTWKTVDVGAAIGDPQSGTFFATIEYDDNLVQQDEWIIGPEGFYSGSLTFWSSGSIFWCRDDNDNCDLEAWLVVGAPGGDDDILLGVAEDDWEDNFEWAQTTFDLDANAPGVPHSLAFRYIGLDGAQVSLDAIDFDFEASLPPVTVDLETFTVAPGESQDVTVSFSSELVPGSTLMGSVDFMSNDPITPMVASDFTMTVVGTPDIAASTDELDFGGVVVGSSYELSVEISNVGTENNPLIISDVVVGDAVADQFAVGLADVGPTFELGVGESDIVVVTFTPLSVGDFSTTLTVTSNDPDTPDLAIMVSAEGLPTPALDLSEMAFSADLVTGAQEDQTLTIGNTGEAGSELAYLMAIPSEVESAGATIQAPEADAEKLARDVNRINMELERPPLYALSNEPVTEFLMLETFDDGIPGTWNVVDNAGSGLVWGATGASGCGEGNYTGGAGGGACASSDQFGNSAFDTELVTPAITVPATAHSTFLVFSANYQNFAAVDFFDVDISTDGGDNWETMLSWNEDHGAFRDLPGEQVALWLDPYLEATDDASPTASAMAQLANAQGLVGSFQVRFRYYIPNGGSDWLWYVGLDDVFVVTDVVNWLSADPAVGTVNAGETTDVTLTFDATLREGGAYEKTVAVVTNDPAAGDATIAASLSVTSAPDIEADRETIAFDETVKGFNADGQFGVFNNGVQTLSIASITSDNGNFLVPNGTLDLEPGFGITIPVRFLPTEVGDLMGNIVVASNDPDEGSFSFPVSGTALATPAISVSSTEIEADVYSSLVDTQTLTITNTGEQGSMLEVGMMLGALAADLTADGDDEIIITHSTSTAMGTESVACTATDTGFHSPNSYWRAFALSDFDVVTTFTTGSVTFGVQSAEGADGTQPITVRIYASTGDAFPDGDRVLLGEETITLDDLTSELVTVPIEAAVPSGAEMVVEVFTPDGRDIGNTLFIGSNDAEETGPSYLSAEACSITTPTTVDDIGFPDMHIVMSVSGTAAGASVTIDPLVGQIAAGQSLDVTFTFDALNADPGVYTTALEVITNVPGAAQATAANDGPAPLANLGHPLAAVLDIPVTMNVSNFTLSTPDMEVHPWEELTIPVNVDAVGGVGLSTYEMTVTYNPDHLIFVQIDKDGTMSSDMEVQSNTVTPGLIRIAAVSPVGPEGAPAPMILDGEGELIKLHFRANRAHGDVDFALDEFMFDEGDLTVYPIIGGITILPKYGDATVDNRVSMLDAYATIRHVAWIEDLHQIGEIHADVSGNGRVSALDAYFIAQFKALIINCFPVEEGCDAASKLGVGDGAIALAPATQETGSELLSVPFVMQSAEGTVGAIELDAAFDGELAEVASISSNLPGDWVFESNTTEEGTVRIVMMGTTPLPQGELGQINFKMKDAASRLTLNASYSINEGDAVSVDAVEVAEIPSQFELQGNYPNPFNPTTMISYQLPESATVRLEIYNVMGQLVRVLVDAEQRAGTYRVAWDARNDVGLQVSSGTYIYRLTAGNYSADQIMTLVK